MLEAIADACDGLFVVCMHGNCLSPSNAESLHQRLFNHDKVFEMELQAKGSMLAILTEFDTTVSFILPPGRGKLCDPKKKIKQLSNHNQFKKKIMECQHLLQQNKNENIEIYLIFGLKVKKLYIYLFI